MFWKISGMAILTRQSMVPTPARNAIIDGQGIIYIVKYQRFAGGVFCNQQDMQIIAILRRICVNTLGDNADAVPVIHFCSIDTERGISAGNVNGQERWFRELFVGEVGSICNVRLVHIKE